MDHAVIGLPWPLTTQLFKPRSYSQRVISTNGRVPILSDSGHVDFESSLIFESFLNSSTFPAELNGACLLEVETHRQPPELAVQKSKGKSSREFERSAARCAVTSVGDCSDAVCCN